MKTIEEAADDFAHGRLIDNIEDSFNGFIAGVEFARKWYPVNEWILTGWIFAKNDSQNKYEAINVKCHSDRKYVEENFAYWQPVEIE